MRLLAGVVALIPIMTVSLIISAGPAFAGCNDELQRLRASLQEQSEGSRHRPELVKLVEKAEKDSRNGREDLCLDAAARAGHLMGSSSP